MNKCKYCQNKLNIWDFLDKVYIICLKDREDRYETALVEVHKSGLCQNVEFYRPERSKDGFASGCWDSHVQITKLALNKNQKLILVLEDDFEFDQDRNIVEVTTQIKNALTKLPRNKWNRLSLGHISWFKLYYADGVNRSSSVLTHAQIWSENGMKWMASHPIDDGSKLIGMQVDGYISYKLPFSYSVTPMVAFQRNEKSDRAMNDLLVQTETLKSSEIWIPIVWAFCIILEIVVVMFVCRYFFHTSYLFAFSICMILFVVPFVIVWILFLTDTC
jgi:hypothetical protein